MAACARSAARRRLRAGITDEGQDVELATVVLLDGVSRACGLEVTFYADATAESARSA